MAGAPYLHSDYYSPIRDTIQKCGKAGLASHRATINIPAGLPVQPEAEF